MPLNLIFNLTLYYVHFMQLTASLGNLCATQYTDHIKWMDSFIIILVFAIFFFTNGKLHTATKNFLFKNKNREKTEENKIIEHIFSA